MVARVLRTASSTSSLNSAEGAHWNSRSAVFLVTAVLCQGRFNVFRADKRTERYLGGNLVGRIVACHIAGQRNGTFVIAPVESVHALAEP